MTRTRLLSTFLAPLALQAVLAGCASTQPAEDVARAGKPAHAYTVAQLPASAQPPAEARRPHFVTCEQCPQRTPKTLLTRSAVSAAAAAEAETQGPASDQRLGAASKSAPSATTARAWRALVYFPFASARLSPSAEEALQALQPVLLKAGTVRITGYTDDIGPAAVNARLASARAETVLRALLALRGEPMRNTEHQGRPLCCYIAPNDAEFTRARNRRVELVFTVVSDPDTEAALKRAAAQVDLLHATNEPAARVSAQLLPQ